MESGRILPAPSRLEADAGRETVLPRDLIIRRRPRGAEGRASSELRRKAELVHGGLPIAAGLRGSRAGNDDRVENDETLLVGDVPDAELEEWLDTPPDPDPEADRQVEAVKVLVLPRAPDSRVPGDPGPGALSHHGSPCPFGPVYTYVSTFGVPTLLLRPNWVSENLPAYWL